MHIPENVEYSERKIALMGHGIGYNIGMDFS